MAVFPDYRVFYQANFLNQILNFSLKKNLCAERTQHSAIDGGSDPSQAESRGITP